MSNVTNIELADINRKKYTERKDSILATISKAKDFYSRLNDDKKVEVFETLYKNLEEGEFSIVVIGEFSSGKSTLLNALMGQRFLPSATKETTATINFLRHKEKSIDGNEGVVYYKDGSNQVIPKAEFEIVEKYVSANGDDVVNKISNLDLFIESEFLKDGVTLVDSPGLNGIADGHKDVTEQQILKSHASLFVFNCDHPGSKTDFDTIAKLQDRVNTIIFVLNKIDVIDTSEQSLDSIIDTLKDSYKKQFPDATTIPEIWPVSAKLALDARKSNNNLSDDESKKIEVDAKLGDFENRLMSFLTNGEKAKQEMSAPIKKVMDILKETKETIDNELEVLNGSVGKEEIEEKIKEIEEVKDNLEGKKIESKVNVQKSVKLATKEVLETFDGKMNSIKQNLLREIDNQSSTDEVDNFVNNFERRYTSKVKGLFEECNQNLEEEIQNIIHIEYGRQSEEIESKMTASDNNISFSVNTDLQLNEIDMSIGLAEMDKNTSDIEDRIRSLESQRSNAESDRRSAKKAERERNALKSELEYIRSKEELIRKQYIPEANTRVEKSMEKEGRGGILGFIGNILIGEKDVQKEKLVTDDKDKKEAINNINDQLKQNSEEQNNIQQQISSLNNYDYQDAHSAVRSYDSRLERMNDELLRIREANIAEMKEKSKTIINSAKNKLSNHCEDLAEDFSKQMKKELKELEKMNVDLISNVVIGTIRLQIEKQEAEIEKLLSHLQGAEDEKNQKIKHCTDNIAEIKAILSEASDIYVDVDSLEVDTIKRENI